MDWQPIETNPVPRDGRWFVIARAGEPDFYEVGCFNPMFWERYEPVGDGLYRKIEEPAYNWRGFNNMHRATHWAYLQEPPQ